MLKINITSTILSILLIYFLANSVITSNTTLRAYFGFTLFFIYVTLIIIHSATSKQKQKLINPLLSGIGLIFNFFLLYAAIMLLAYSDTGPISVSLTENLRYFAYSSGGALVTLTMIVSFKGSQKELNLIILFTLALSVTALYQVYSSRETLLLDNPDEFVVSNWALVFTSLIPFVFLIRKTWLQALLISIIFIGIFMGSKRSAILTLGFIFLVLFIYTLIFKRDNLKGWKIWILYLIATFFIIFFYNNFSELYLSAYDRFLQLNVDGGSGRSNIWLETIEYLNKTNLEFFIFGGGAKFYSLSINSLYSSTHNDLLELLVSYGLFGLLFYFSLLVRLIYLVFYHIKKNTSFVYFSLSLLISFFIMSNISGVFIYYSYYVSFFIAFAILEIISKNNKIEKI